MALETVLNEGYSSANIEHNFSDIPDGAKFYPANPTNREKILNEFENGYASVKFYLGIDVNKGEGGSGIAYFSKLEPFYTTGGFFTISMCKGDWINRNSKTIYFSKIKDIKDDKEKKLAFYQALTIAYGKKKRGVDNIFYFDPWYHISALADMSEDINRRTS
jgi:hypothetical protein